MVPGHQRAERDLHEGEHDKRPCGETLAGPMPAPVWLRRAAQRRHQRCKEQRGKDEMQRKLHRRDRRHSRLQSGRDHHPADDALRPEEETHRGESDKQLASDTVRRIANQRNPAM